MGILSPLKRRWRAEGGYRQVLAMAVPLILSTGSWSIQSFINRMFLAWHSPESLAASMPAGMVSYALFGIFITTAGYVSTFVAQYHGAGKDERVGRMVWQALGRDDPAQARYSVRSAFDMTLLYMGVVAALFMLLPRVFLSPFAAASDPATFKAIGDLTAVLLRFVAVYTLFDAFTIIFSSAIKGAGDTRFVMWMILSLSAGVLVVPNLVAITWFAATIYICWTIASLYVIVLGVAFFLRYRQGKWEAMRVIESAPAGSPP